MTLLLTGTAGFIGYHLAHKLLSEGHTVVGVDNLNSYYSVELKEARLKLLKSFEKFTFHKLELSDSNAVNALFNSQNPQYVIHLAAQAGVRYSIENPHAYIDSNIVGMLTILEACRHFQVEHLVYASSSSVYGLNTRMPFSEKQSAEHPVSFYGATKKSNEMMAHSYASMYQMPVTGLRFFTVYGPWGRPDMAYFKFADKISRGETIQVFNHGKHQRDFTYIDDIVNGITGVLEKIPEGNSSEQHQLPTPESSHAPYKIYNIGNNNPVELAYFIKLIEQNLGRSAIIEYVPMQVGDVLATYADIDALKADVGYSPKTSIEDGLVKFLNWYQGYYKEDNVTQP